MLGKEVLCELNTVRGLPLSHEWYARPLETLLKNLTWTAEKW